MLNKINNIEKTVLIFSILIIVSLSIVFNSSFLLTIISICGILYVFLISKKLKTAYIFGIINVLLYGILLLSNKIYGGAIYNLCYGFPILIYGWYYWSKRIKANNVNHFSKNQKRLFVCLYTIIISLSLIALIVQKDIIFACDIFTTGFGMIGIYLLSKKFVEQWPVWISSNFINTILWLFLTIESIKNIPVFVMWLMYFINSIYGFYMWKQNN